MNENILNVLQQLNDQNIIVENDQYLANVPNCTFYFLDIAISAWIDESGLISIQATNDIGTTLFQAQVYSEFDCYHTFKFLIKLYCPRYKVKNDDSQTINQCA